MRPFSAAFARRFVSALAVLVTVVACAVAAPPKVGDTVPDFELDALDGGKVKISRLVKQGPLVLVVLRGFPGYQCPVCTAQVGQLVSRSKQFAAAKAQVLLVYPGPAEGLKQRAAEFARGKGLPKNFRLALDPDYAFTKRYDLRWDAPNETAYPSTFVIDGKGKVTYAKVSRSHGDRAPVTEVLAALGK